MRGVLSAVSPLHTAHRRLPCAALCPLPNGSLSFGMFGSADRAIPGRQCASHSSVQVGVRKHGAPRTREIQWLHHQPPRHHPAASSNPSPTTSPAPSSAPANPSSRSTRDDASPPAASTGDPASSSPHITPFSARRRSPSRSLTARPSPPRSSDAIPRPTSLSSRSNEAKVPVASFAETLASASARSCSRSADPARHHRQPRRRQRGRRRVAHVARRHDRPVRATRHLRLRWLLRRPAHRRRWTRARRQHVGSVAGRGARHSRRDREPRRRPAVKTARVARGYLGLGMQAVRLPAALVERLSLPNDIGLMVVSAEPGGPGDTAGILIGDVLIAIGGHARRVIPPKLLSLPRRRSDRQAGRSASHPGGRAEDRVDHHRRATAAVARHGRRGR